MKLSLHYTYLNNLLARNQRRLHAVRHSSGFGIFRLIDWFLGPI